MARVRERGYALTHGQRIQGAVGLAVPIFSSRGAVIGDVCLTIPEQRYDPGGESRLATELLECATRITADLGGHSPPRRAVPSGGHGSEGAEPEPARS
jgi:DNA-binding IclR family transcriptional regulator